MGGDPMLIKRVPIGELSPGARFRFQEEPNKVGFPYIVMPVPTRYRGERKYFDAGERPVVIRRKDDHYPPYGTISGFFPVKNDDGKLVYWVAHPHTEVVVPTRLAIQLRLGFIRLILAIAAIVAAITVSYGLISSLR